MSLEVSNLTQIDQFKQIYIDKLEEEGLTCDRIRMFAMGKELKDDLFIYSYDIMNDLTVQVMIKSAAA